MKSFDLVEPATLEEAVALLDPEDAGVRSIAGGTALMLMMKARLFQPARLVSLRRLNGALRGVREDGRGGLRIGAMTTLVELERSPQVAATFPVLTGALRTLSNVRIRNVATLGGHLAHGDPHMDLPPILLALGARVRTVGPIGERWIDMADLFIGYYQLAIAQRRVDRRGRRACPAGQRIHVLREIRGAVGRRLAVGRRGGLVPHGRRPDRRRARRRERRHRSADARVWRRGGACRAPKPPRRRLRGPATRRPRKSSRWPTSAAAPPTSVRWCGCTCVGRSPRRCTRHRGPRDNMPRLETPELDRDSRAPYREVGQSVPRLEGAAKVTGSAEYIHNLRLPGMLHGKIYRSSIAHGRIVADRFERRARARGRARRHHDRRGADAGAEPVLRTGLPRPADPRARKGPARRRTGRRRAGRRPARRRGSSRPDRDRVRADRGGVRRGRGRPSRRTRSFTTC